MVTASDLEPRWERLAQELATVEADALLSGFPPTVVALTGLYPRNGQALVVFAPGAGPYLLVPEVDALDGAPVAEDVRVARGDWREQVRTWIQDLRRVGVLGSGVRLATEEPEVTSPAYLAAEGQAMPRRWREEILASLKATEVDATQALARVRRRKLPAERPLLRRAARVAAMGLAALRDQLRPGVTEAQLVARVEAAVREGGPGTEGARAVWAFAQVVGGRRTRQGALPSLVPGTEPLAEGDLVILELATVVDGYWSDLTRTLVVGGGEAHPLIQAVREAGRRAIAKVRGGAAAASVDAQARGFLAERGMAEGFCHHTGHGLGFSYHEPAPFVAPGSSDELMEGDVITVEPGVYGEQWGGGARWEENVWVEAAGATLLSEEG